jgi:hypothetical protein
MLKNVGETTTVTISTSANNATVELPRRVAIAISFARNSPLDLPEVSSKLLLPPGVALCGWADLTSEFILLPH